MIQAFSDRSELAAWLISAGIDPATWGRDGAKSLANLWDEYVAGEIDFRGPPPLRVVQVVQLVIQRDQLWLVEISQELRDMQRRYRHQPPSEKIKQGEDYRTAAARCLREELGLEIDDYQFLNEPVVQRTALRDSASYPGLHARYTIYEVTVVVDGLPQGEFWRDNTAAADGDPVLRHLWGWRPRDEQNDDE